MNVGLLLVVVAAVTFQQNHARYVAIGDSYSIGEGVSPGESWPALLTAHLRREGIPIELVANPSRTGWTTAEAIEHELPILRDARPHFATLQIGVNDWVQGIDADTFRKRFGHLADEILSVLSSPKRLLVVTIPDFSVAPNGPKYARGRNISEGLAAFNRVIRDESAKRRLRVVDLFETSRRMGADPSLVAPDGLHPSAKEYMEWEKVIYPVARELLKEQFGQR